MNDEILLIDKPAGMSSFGVVARVRRKLSEQAGFVMIKDKDGVERQKRKKVKVGHTGTLDPFATGLLIILTGKETKRANEFLKLDKEYIATIRLGAISTTGDIEGEIRPFISNEEQSYATISSEDRSLRQPAVAGVAHPAFSVVTCESSSDERLRMTGFCVRNRHLSSPATIPQPVDKLEDLSTRGEEEEASACNDRPEELRVAGEDDGWVVQKDSVHDWSPALTDVKEVVQSFVGEIEQTVPAYSAVKINGQRAYKLAREGKEVEMPRRKVQIYEIEILHYEWPELEIRCKVSSGTYIRTLGEDIGKALGVGGYLTALRRTQVGKYRVEDAYKLEDFLTK